MMAKTVLFEEQTVAGFSVNPVFGLYYAAMPKTFSLIAGESYNVLWGSETYKVTAQDASSINGGAEMVAIGDGTAFGLAGNGEPFAIATTDEALLFYVLDPSDTSTEHRVAIWQGADGLAIVIKDRDGNPVTHDVTKDTIRVVDAGGNLMEFIPADNVPEVVENIPIALDFSAGDQTILAPDGYLVKSAILQKPDAMIPENIAEGVNIAGIVGALVAGGGDVKIEVGTNGVVSFAGATIAHSLGCVPDILIAIPNAQTFSTYALYPFAVSFSTAFSERYGLAGQTVLSYSTSGLAAKSVNEGLENINRGWLRADAETIRMSYGQPAGVWVAVAGLT